MSQLLLKWNPNLDDRHFKRTELITDAFLTLPKKNKTSFLFSCSGFREQNTFPITWTPSLASPSSSPSTAPTPAAWILWGPPPPCSPPSQPPHLFYHFLMELLQNLGFGFSASSFGSPPVRHSQAASDPFQMENRSRHWPKSFSLPSRYKSHSFGPFWFNAYLPPSFTSFYALLLSGLCSCHSGLLLRVVLSCPCAFAREDLTHNPSGHLLFPCGEQPPRSTWHIMDAQ